VLIFAKNIKDLLGPFTLGKNTRQENIRLKVRDVVETRHNTTPQQPSNEMFGSKTAVTPSIAVANGSVSEMRDSEAEATPTPEPNSLLRFQCVSHLTASPRSPTNIHRSDKCLLRVLNFHKPANSNSTRIPFFGQCSLANDLPSPRGCLVGCALYEAHTCPQFPPVSPVPGARPKPALCTPAPRRFHPYPTNRSACHRTWSSMKLATKK
jgi:hypothetical protein